MKGHILIVDDDRYSCQTLEALLAPYGSTVHNAHSGAEAIAYLSREPVDLVITDVMMPAMDGFELCRQIKAHPQWRYIPVILVTALDDESDMVHGFDAGADEFLCKPVNKFALRARVRVMLRVRARYRELMAVQPVSNLEELVRRRVDELAESVQLSKREREVLDLLLLGRNTEEIGTALQISARTAKFHQANVLEKLGVESRNELFRLFL